MIDKSAAVTFVDKLGRHSPWAGCVGGFQLVLSLRYTQKLFG